MWNGARYLVGVLAAVLWTSACGDSSLVGVGNGESPDSVVVSPEMATLEDIGEVGEFSAVAYQGDEPLPDPDIAWVSTDFAVATVSADGVAIARSAGQTFIVASVGEVADSASLTVNAVDPGT